MNLATVTKCVREAKVSGFLPGHITSYIKPPQNTETLPKRLCKSGRWTTKANYRPRITTAEKKNHWNTYKLTEREENYDILKPARHRLGFFFRPEDGTNMFPPPPKYR
jgi:hypothetical protein